MFHDHFDTPSGATVSRRMIKRKPFFPSGATSHTKCESFLLKQIEGIVAQQSAEALACLLRARNGRDKLGHAAIFLALTSSVNAQLPHLLRGDGALCHDV